MIESLKRNSLFSVLYNENGQKVEVIDVEVDLVSYQMSLVFRIDD